MRHYRAQRPPNFFFSFPLSQKTKTVNSGGRNKPKTQFFQMCLLPGQHSAVCLLSLSVCQEALWTLWGGLPAPPRGRSSQLHPHLAATSRTSLPNFHPAPNFFFLSFFSPPLASANYKHMRPCGSTDCCQTSRLLFPLSSALWHAGRFILPPPPPPPPNGASTLG